MKVLLENSNENILVLTYTNHALDQFLEDALDIGVTEEQMLRLGSKSTARTKPLGLWEQSVSYRRSQPSYSLLAKHSDDVDMLSERIQEETITFQRLGISIMDLLDLLEFSDSDSDFYHALSTPQNADGMSTVDRRGRATGSSYVIDRWLKGENAGVFQRIVAKNYPQIWAMDAEARRACVERWTREFFMEHAVMLQNTLDEYAETYEHWKNVREERSTAIIGGKRIIGCTTTAAAKYAKELLNARPGVIIVEEAGEILESHILTALSTNVKQLILIGDHQQLRPKINNYALTVERGNGDDLNKSLFERLVIAGYPHTTLQKQHRMRPEISALVRHLTYPDLQDDAKTLDRPHIRGLQSNIVFFNHDQPEVENRQLADRRDEGSKISKQNVFEAEMVLKIVRYLAQQGYGTEKQVVLTPYLGQLGLLLKYLKEDQDPVLNDMDSFDLVKAGLLPQASAHASKRRLRVSSIGKLHNPQPYIMM